MRPGRIVCVIALLAAAPALAQQPHNVVLFVPDGLRAHSVDKDSAPAMAAVRDEGVNFANSHSLFPTFTTANASGFATGHALGDTGDFSNTIFAGHAIAAAGGSVTPFLESDAVLGEMDARFRRQLSRRDDDPGGGARGGARHRGHRQDRAGARSSTTPTARGSPTYIIDDATGSAAGIPLSAELRDALAAAELPLAAPGRGANGDAGDANRPGTKVANVAQQNYFADAATKAVLPLLQGEGQAVRDGVLVARPRRHAA